MYWFRRLFLSGVVLLAVFFTAAWFLFQRSVPDYDATHSVNGLEDSVEIIRTAYAVPHIFGTTDTDSFFGLGYTHAQDRMFQMEIQRRTAQGRLSEM